MTLITLIKEIHEEIRVQCSYCEEKFVRTSDINIHIAMKHDEKVKKACKICSKPFSSNSTLNKHMTSHSNERFECDYCDKHYQYTQSLKNHVAKIHPTESKNYFT